jgi:hypothetical protein
MSQSTTADLCRQVFDAMLWLAQGVYTQEQHDSYVLERYREAEARGIVYQFDLCITRRMIQLTRQAAHLNRVRFAFMEHKRPYEEEKRQALDVET